MTTDRGENTMQMEVNLEPNLARAVWVEGQLNDALLERVRPEILDLTSRSREPITVFLNSSGGSPEVVNAILRLLRSKAQDDPRGSTIITVAAPRAGSGAANILSAGDFAIAYSDSQVLWHGGRWPLADLLDTGEAALVYARTLPTFRELTAATLAASCARRFMSIVSVHRPLFANDGAEKTDPAVDLKCFQLILRGKLSPAGQTVLDRAIEFDDAFNGLLVEFHKKLRRGRAVTTTKLRRIMQHASSDFVYATSSDAELGWDGGLGRIADHFYCLNSYFDVERFREWIAKRPSPQPSDAEADYLLRFRQFFLSVCRALQQGENSLTPSDALWLGLVDSLRDAPTSRCPWCSRSDLPLHRLKIHVKNCAAAPRPRWAEHQKRTRAHAG